MRICDTYNHFQALTIIVRKNDVWEEITEILEEPDLLFGRNRPQEIKSRIAVKFNRLGWADRVRIHSSSNLTISFMKDRVGVCIQLGNAARIYADLLKLALLGKKGIIDAGVIILPNKFESRLLGTNYAHFDRVSREMNLFGDIISTPVLVIALAN